MTTIQFIKKLQAELLILRDQHTAERFNQLLDEYYSNSAILARMTDADLIAEMDKRQAAAEAKAEQAKIEAAAKVKQDREDEELRQLNLQNEARNRAEREEIDAVVTAVIAARRETHG